MADNQLGKYLNPEIVSAVKRLDLQAKCIVDGYLSGRHHSPNHGFSTQFSEHRSYIKGDPLKDIDWKVYARSNKYTVRKYEAETNLECTLIVDISSSMGFKHEKSSFSKLEYAICLSAALSLLLTKQQDSVGLITFDNKVRHYIRPASKRSHLMSILNTLVQVETGEPTIYADSLPSAVSLLRHRGLVVLFTDLLGDTESALKTLQILSHQKHDVIVFQIFDPIEIDLNYDSLMDFQDTENSNTHIIAHPEQIKQAYRAEINKFIEATKTSCENARITYCFMSSAEPFDKAIQEFMKRRSRKA